MNVNYNKNLNFVTFPSNLVRVLMAVIIPFLSLFILIQILVLPQFDIFFDSAFIKDFGIGILIFISVLYLIFITLLAEWAAKYRAIPNRTVIDLSTLKQGLLSFGESTMPIEIEQVGEDKIKVRWKYADQRFVHLFGAGVIKGGYNLLLKFSPRNHTVYASETMTKLKVSAEGFITSSITANYSFFKGISLFTFNYASGYGFCFKDGNIQFDQMYQYSFNPDELKGPLVTYIINNGWNYSPKVFLI
jgi:hypothetical protein